VTEERENLPQLPKGWIWEKLGSLAQEINPGFPSGKWVRGEKQGIPHLRPMNISSDGSVDLTDLKYVNRNNYDPLIKGDILFNNTNSPKLLGKTALYQREYYLGIFKPHDSH